MRAILVFTSASIEPSHMYAHKFRLKGLATFGANIFLFPKIYAYTKKRDNNNNRNKQKNNNRIYNTNKIFRMKTQICHTHSPFKVSKQIIA